MEDEASSVTSTTPSLISTTPEDVLQFWFKDVDPPNDVYASKLWFNGGPDFDKECEEKFGEPLKLAIAGAFNGWMATVRGRLALVILFDQISRNVYRNSASAFAQDAIARKITLEGINQGWDKELGPIERWFLYLPLMHSENLEDHDISERVFQELADEFSANKKLHEQLLNTLAFEKEHRVVVEKFGRYPGRNLALGRSSTEEEEKYLSTSNSW